MLTIITLTGLLSNPLYSANGYSPSERRTLQSAVEMSLQDAELNRFQQFCINRYPESAMAKVYPQSPITKRQDLLQQKLKMTDLSAITLIDRKMTSYVKNSITELNDCEDYQSYQVLLDKYELTVFSLEIATELKKAPITADASNKQLAASKSAEIKKLIERSNAIALVSISDRQLLNVIEQANFLHIDYDSRYIFKVNQGWKNMTPTYMGMHVAIDDTTISNTASEWLVFLDHNKHFIEAVKKNDASMHLRLLAKPDWQFDNQGNLIR
ncbi:hypothetical protein [Rheinheimera sp. MMS21-TC3]|uniref:hypothetical protein n=1 Tax=Rheinheimera sp. MMS21-TC3 TaxID=3072790 RepID=UPI0028C4EA89|nr:hypothetical protein [Rheinheimera sp. MMS21-TC3]WNO59716.1 hypothetical protein RDV63_01800 [Rheinheimera sp. MMS21-TC3]